MTWKKVRRHRYISTTDYHIRAVITGGTDYWFAFSPDGICIVNDAPTLPICKRLVAKIAKERESCTG